MSREDKRLFSTRFRQMRLRDGLSFAAEREKLGVTISDAMVKLIGIAAAEYGDYDTGANIRVSCARLAGELGPGVSKRTVKKAFWILETAGLFVCTRRGGPHPGSNEINYFRAVMPGEVVPPEDIGMSCTGTTVVPPEDTRPSSSDQGINPLEAKPDSSQKKRAAARPGDTGHATAPRGAPAAPAGICNAYLVSRDGSFRKAIEDGAAVDPRAGEERIDLSPGEGKSLWSARYGPRGKLTEERLGYMRRKREEQASARRAAAEEWRGPLRRRYTELQNIESRGDEEQAEFAELYRRLYMAG
jgi:hypothetical protein